VHVEYTAYPARTCRAYGTLGDFGDAYPVLKDGAFAFRGLRPPGLWVTTDVSDGESKQAVEINCRSLVGLKASSG
jgi:hypothetical protein